MTGNTFYLNDGKRYTVKPEKGHYKVIEGRPMFDGSFYVDCDCIYLDNYREVREYLTDLNGGVEVY